MIRAVLIDLDGVVRRWAPWEPSEGSPVTNEAIRAVAFEADVLLGVVTGGVTDEQWREEVAVRLEREYGPHGRRAMEEWSAPIGEVAADVLEVVRALRKIVPVALISNATSRLESDLERLGLTGEFDLVVNSSRVGYAKPDERIFRHAAKQLGVAPDECLFIDDTEGHVTAAAGLGMRTIHFTAAPPLRSALSSYGLLAAPHVELLIRRANLADADEMASVLLRTEVHAYSSIFPSEAPPPAIDELRTDWITKLKQHPAFVAVVDNAIVGTVIAGADPKEPRTGHLSRMYVVPELSGRGIGTRLYHTCLREFAELGYAEATLWVLERNERARRWYEQLGWIATGERKPVYAPAGIDDLRYRLTSI